MISLNFTLLIVRHCCYLFEVSLIGRDKLQNHWLSITTSKGSIVDQEDGSRYEVDRRSN